MITFDKLLDYRDRGMFKPYNKGYLVYKITNLVNGKAYIGCTKQIVKRIGDHIRTSKKPKSSSHKYIHKSMAKHGLNNFSIEILELCRDLDEMNDKEAFYIDRFNTMDSDIGYNLDSGGNIRTPSESNLKKRKLNNPRCRKVAQYDESGQLFCVHWSVREASRQTGVSDSDIHRCCKKNWSAKGWRFRKFEEYPECSIEVPISKRGGNFRGVRLQPWNSKSCIATCVETGRQVVADSFLELDRKLNKYKGFSQRTIKTKNPRQWKIILQESL